MTISVESRPRVAPQVRGKTPADVLRSAARIIEERGWCQAVIQDPKGRVCAYGAIDLASDGVIGNGGDDPLEAMAYLAMMSFLGHRTILPQWNDKPGRTSSEVIAALNGAADAYEQDATRR